MNKEIVLHHENQDCEEIYNLGNEFNNLVGFILADSDPETEVFYVCIYDKVFISYDLIDIINVLKMILITDFDTYKQMIPEADLLDEVTIFFKEFDSYDKAVYCALNYNREIFG